MTIDLETQLRDYASHVTEISPTVDVDALLTEPPEAIPLPAPRLQPRWGVALAAAAILVVLIGGLALGYRLLVTDVEPVVTQPSSTIVTPTTVQSAPETTLPGPSTTVAAPTTTLAASPPMSWDQAPPQAALGKGDDQHEYIMHTVVSSEGRLIAAGSIYSAEESKDPLDGATGAIWISENAVDWELVPTDGLDVDAAIHDLAVGDFGYLAVGETLEAGAWRPAVWISPDLTSWTAVQPDTFGGWVLMGDVAAGEKGIVAVGSGIVWFSPDGWTWQRVRDSDNRVYEDVVATDWGFVVAGWREQSVSAGGALAMDLAPRLSVSEDGLEWEDIELPEDESWFGAQAHSVHVRGDDILVAGSYRSREHTYFGMHPAFWASTDRVKWDVNYLRPTNVPELRDESTNLRDLVVTDRGPIAVGGWFQYGVGPPHQFFPGKSMPAVWAAPDNQEWGEFTPRIFGLETFDDAVGSTHGFDDVVIFDGKIVAVASQQGQAIVWIGQWTE